MDIETLKIEVESWLKEYFLNRGSYNKKIYEAMEYSIKIGGKRIRPLLMTLTYLIYKEDYKNVIPIAAAIEMIHTYSLIHDDLPCMDNDDLRRGSPTNHKIFGEGIAVLAGDGLLSEAMNIMFEFCLDKGEVGVKACKLISNSAGVEGMIGGQVVDILSENKQISSSELLYMHKKKTGELIKASILSGAILGNANQRELSLLESFGEKLGLAFQIKDDILDVVGNTNVLGKKIKSDENNSKTTFITTFGLEKSEMMCTNLTKECIDILNDINHDTSLLEEITLFLLKRDF